MPRHRCCLGVNIIPSEAANIYSHGIRLASLLLASLRHGRLPCLYDASCASYLVYSIHTCVHIYTMYTYEILYIIIYRDVYPYVQTKYPWMDVIMYRDAHTCDIHRYSHGNVYSMYIDAIYTHMKYVDGYPYYVYSMFMRLIFDEFCIHWILSATLLIIAGCAEYIIYLFIYFSVEDYIVVVILIISCIYTDSFRGFVLTVV